VGKAKEKATLSGHMRSVSSVAFSPDGQTLASGSRDTTVQLWYAATDFSVYWWYRHHARLFPNDVDMQVDFSCACWGLYLHRKQSRELADAAPILREGRDVLTRLKAGKKLSTDQEKWIAAFDDALENLPAPGR
jgi:hypothetical protein